MKITAEQFAELTGENTVDVLGEDWENEVEEYLEDSGLLCAHCGNTPDQGACFNCKMD